eukprot:g15915.t1
MAIEAREELLEGDLWRYRTEHVRSNEENKVLCSLRQKALPVFGKTWVAPPTGIRPRPTRLNAQGAKDSWQNPWVQDPFEFVPHAYPICRNREQLREKIRKREMNKNDSVKSPTGISNMR